MIYRALELTLAPALRAAYKPVATGAANVPLNGPVIIAANHLSFADEFFTPAMARRQVMYLAKAEYFDSPGARGWAMKQFFGSLGHVPVDRDAIKAAAASIDLCVSVLAKGHALGIYPEGTRSPDGRLYRFRTGVARLALRSGAPVVPLGIIGTREVQPPGEKLWRRAPVELNFGEALSFGHLADQERSSKVLREVAETIRQAVQKLSRQEYIDTYASNAKVG